MDPTTYDHRELFSDHPRRARFADPGTEEPRAITGPDEYGAAVTALRALRTALISLDSTGVTTGAERNRVWGVAQSLTEHVRAYQQKNNLPPPDVTP